MEGRALRSVKEGDRQLGLGLIARGSEKWGVGGCKDGSWLLASSEVWVPGSSQVWVWTFTRTSRLKPWVRKVPRSMQWSKPESRWALPGEGEGKWGGGEEQPGKEVMKRPEEE